jgi:hypothetical protein
MIAADKRFAVFCLLGLIAFHAAHVFEEAWGRFFLLSEVFGLGGYLALHWLLFLIPLVLLYYLLIGNSTAEKLAVAYAAFMILNGIGHNAATLITGRYFDGFAGGFTGIGLAAFGILYLFSGRRKADPFVKIPLTKNEYAEESHRPARRTNAAAGDRANRG